MMMGPPMGMPPMGMGAPPPLMMPPQQQMGMGPPLGGAHRALGGETGMPSWCLQGGQQPRVAVA